MGFYQRGMVKYGFGDKFIELVMGYISELVFAVLVNGSLTS